MNLENELREALRREAAPEGFADRVLAKTRGAGPMWRRPVVLAVAAALVMTVAIPSEVARYRRREQRRAIEARDQLIQALAITRVQLRHAKEQIRRNTRHTL